MVLEKLIVGCTDLVFSRRKRCLRAPIVLRRHFDHAPGRWESRFLVRAETRQSPKVEPPAIVRNHEKLPFAALYAQGRGQRFFLKDK